MLQYKFFFNVKKKKSKIQFNSYYVAGQPQSQVPGRGESLKNEPYASTLRV